MNPVRAAILGQPTAYDRWYSGWCLAALDWHRFGQLERDRRISEFIRQTTIVVDAFSEAVQRLGESFEEAGLGSAALADHMDEFEL